MTPAIFLDKDGTLLDDVPYNTDPARMRFSPGAREGLACLATLNLPVCVVSNQPGIALRKFSAASFHRMREHLHAMCAAAGMPLAGFYYCPHAPIGAGQVEQAGCRCRKPRPGLLLDAAGQHGIDLRRSWMVGDILDDVEAGRRAGCRTILIDNGNETEWVVSRLRVPDYCAPDLGVACRLLVAEIRAADGVPA